ncbi:MAG: alpha/beta hydrolase [Marinilabiliales bacterium]|nr:alpha/beta hydrolase [Marinilabiliales bacterium]
MKTFKKILKLLLALVLTLAFILSIPRILSAVFPKKAPVGYYYQTPTIAAVVLGLETLINKTPPLPENVEAIKNIEYKNLKGRSLQLDIYRPKQMTAPAPLLVFIHGGGWTGGNRADYLVYLAHFASLGYVTATVSYRFVKESPYPACVEDVNDAVDFLLANGGKYNYDPTRVCLIGGSAGAHLALLAGYGWKSSQAVPDSTARPRAKYRVKAVVEIYGPIDFTTEYARNHPTITNFMAHPYAEAKSLYEEASPISWVTKDCPPTMILHGTRDMLVPVTQAEMLKNKLDSLHVPNVYYTLPGWPHTMDIVKRVNDHCKILLGNFFEKYVK